MLYELGTDLFSGRRLGHFLEANLDVFVRELRGLSGLWFDYLRFRVSSIFECRSHHE